jgi:putative transcriptional regulator
LTGDQKHTDHITNGQRVSRHSLPTLLYFLFSPPHIFLIQFYCQPHKWHIWFCPTHKPTLRKTKRAIFCQRTDRQNDNNSNTFYIEKQDSRKIKSIFADSFQTDMNRIKEVLEEKGVKQTWLAEQLGKSYNMVNGYVQNRQQPRLEVLFEIAKILGVKPQELLKDKK